MNIELNSLLNKEEEGFKLQLQVKDAVMKKDADPYQAGMGFLSSGIRFSAIFGDLHRGRQFFEAARELLSRVVFPSIESNRSGLGFDPEEAFFRMRVHFGLFGLSCILGPKEEHEHLCASIEAVAPAFADEYIPVLLSRIANGTEDATSVSAVHLSLLSMVLIAKKRNRCEVALPNICRSFPNSQLFLEVGRFRELRKRLIAVILAGNDAEDEISSEELSERFSEEISLESYKSGLINGLTFVDVWMISSARNGGDLESGILTIFNRHSR